MASQVFAAPWLGGGSLLRPRPGVWQNSVTASSATTSSVQDPWHKWQFRAGEHSKHPQQLRQPSLEEAHPPFTECGTEARKSRVCLTMRGSFIMIHARDLAKEYLAPLQAAHLAAIQQAPVSLTAAAPAGQGWRSKLLAKKAARVCEDRSERTGFDTDLSETASAPPVSNAAAAPDPDLIEALVQDRLRLLIPSLVAQTRRGLDEGLNFHSARGLVAPEDILRRNVAVHAGFHLHEPLSSMTHAELNKLQRGHPQPSPISATASVKIGVNVVPVILLDDGVDCPRQECDDEKEDKEVNATVEAADCGDISDSGVAPEMEDYTVVHDALQTDAARILEAHGFSSRSVECRFAADRQQTQVLVYFGSCASSQDKDRLRAARLELLDCLHRVLVHAGLLHFQIFLCRRPYI
mmetsp:Transcript_79235/g.227264  ORF Transcript_79235/g.227264 Transcript_79235/m.227264 type:complete len:408 (-) Transcript_79235:225-1448(-)